MKISLTLALALGICIDLFGQHISGHVIDNETKEPLIGATVLRRSNGDGTITDLSGYFQITGVNGSDTLEVTYIGYQKALIPHPATNVTIPLSPSANNLQQVVVTANREAALRTDAPLAISKLSATVINDTKPILLTELINKIPGVLMLNYNNEQHAMSIRQPMGISPYFLYMEDGVPIRPMGVFNHNALIETNVFAVSSMEVVKGPASSLYGPEAVGGAINFITHRATAMTTAKLGMQADHWGYQRIQYATGGNIAKKLGVYVSGFQARQRDSWQAHSDYDKSSINIRLDYSLSDKTAFTATFASNEYETQMAGSIDSTAFYNRVYPSTTDFTYRQVHAQRTRFTASHQWNDANETILTLAYRDNFIEQVPNYSIRWTTGSRTASGERNRNTFYSKVALLQHNVVLNKLHAKIVSGGMVDLSPVSYWAYSLDLTANLRPDGTSVERYALVQERPDVALADYSADLRNYAAYTQFEVNPVERLKVTLGVRYDIMSFDYQNRLDASAGSKSYKQFTPKIGATFDLLRDKGLYVNYSEGFSPPALTSIFRKRPGASDGNEFYYDLEPARFTNMEFGGWAALLDSKLYLDAAVYQMLGRNELITIRQPDNATHQQSAGKTLHRGIEYGLAYQPRTDWLIRLGGTNALHRFQDFQLSNRSTDFLRNVNGNDMPHSPRWIGHSEVMYKPQYLKGFRISLEWQRISTWYQDQINRIKYDDEGFLSFKGVSYINFRMGYAWRGLEIFTNVMNATNERYANAAGRGNLITDKSTYTPAAPRTFVLGIQYNFTRKNMLAP